MDVFGSDTELFIKLLFSVILSLILGLIPAFIADRKGRSFLLWWIIGGLLFPFSLLVVFSQPNTEVLEKRKINAGNMIKCPFCAEIIKREARVCKFCGRELTFPKRKTKPDRLMPPTFVPCPHCQKPIDIAGLSDGEYDCPNCLGKFVIGNS